MKDRLRWICYVDPDTRNRLLIIATKWMKSKLEKDSGIPGWNDEHMRDRLRMSLYYRAQQLNRRLLWKSYIVFYLQMKDPHNIVLNSRWS